MDEHDFRTLAERFYSDLCGVLTTIVGFADILQDDEAVGPVSDLQRDTAHGIEVNGRYAFFHLEYTYLVMRLRTGDRALNRQPADLNVMIPRALDTARRGLAHAGVTVTFVPAPRVAMIAADLEYLEALFNQLVWEMRTMPHPVARIQVVMEDRGLRCVIDSGDDATRDAWPWPTSLSLLFAESVVTAHGGTVEQGMPGRLSLLFPQWDGDQG